MPARIIGPRRRAPPNSEPRRGLRREDAARYIGISTAKFDECVKDGRMPKPFKINGCVIWDLRLLDAAFDALSETSEPNSFAD